MPSFKYKSERVGNGRNKFQSFKVKTYSNENPSLTTIPNHPIKENGIIKGCNGQSRTAYCCGSVFRNPIPGYRKKANVECTIKMQEIYKDPYTKSCGKTCYYDRRIRTMNNKNGVKDTDYNYDYNQYLKKRCKTFEQNNIRFLNTDGKTYRSNCSNVDLSCNTYKIKNKKFSTNSAVSSSSRLNRLRYDTIVGAQGKNCKNGDEVCGIYTSNTRYKNKNLDPKIKQCKYMRIAGVMRKCGR
jgi:hypothetical protein|tara:strand:+ start:533 stop:1255 length:723 start_codon:yes stop_codon:yes gene_type:complete